MSQKIQTPIMQQYNAIKVQYPDCIILFRLGDFYEMFFDDAKIASSILDIVLTQRAKNTLEPIPMCGIPAHASETYVARLIKHGFKVAICEQMEKSKEKTEKLVRREVVRVVTAGTITEDTLLQKKAHNFLIALHGGPDKTVSIACVDISTGTFFVDTHPLAELDSVLTALDPKEILIADSLAQILPEILWNTWKHAITAVNASRFDRGEERLASFFNVKTVKSFGDFSVNEMAAAGGLLDYVMITQKKEALALRRLRRSEKNQHLYMDSFTQKNLEILRTLDGNEKGSLLFVIDRTLTGLGARLLHWRITHPIRHLPSLLMRLDSVSFFVEHTSIRNSVRQHLTHIPDAERCLSRLLIGRGTPRDMLFVAQTLRIMPAISMPFHNMSLPDELSEAIQHLNIHQNISSLLDKALGECVPVALRDGNVIAPGYDPDLDELRVLRDESHTVVEELEQQYIKETHINTLKIKHNAIIGYYIEVTSAQVGKVPFSFVLKQSLVSGSRYTTPALIALEEKLNNIHEKIQAKEEQLFLALIDTLSAQAHGLRKTFDSIAILDVSVALAQVAIENKYVRPDLDYSLNFSVSGGRHPVIEHYAEHEFIKNDCLLTHDKPIWLMTGPNMAGKSTFLRQNALIVLMSHIGSFVPAEKASIGIVDRIFSRVGAWDNLSKGYSTFMIEMIETATIMNQATAHSFVIFDEVGRGTSTHDGVAIAWSCVEYLSQKIGCRTLFSTHYHELAGLEKTVSQIACYTLHIQEWDSNVVFLYKVIPGVAQRSYGIHVARLAGMPESIIHRAENILATFNKEK